MSIAEIAAGCRMISQQRTALLRQIVIERLAARQKGTPDE